MLRNLLVFPLVLLVVLIGSARAIAPSFELLGQFPARFPSSHANAVSHDGQVVVGASRFSDSFAFAPFRWTASEGLVEFAGVLPTGDGRAYGVSADGRVVVGSIWDGAGVTQAFRWTQEEGLLILPSAPGWESRPIEATGVSADGSVVVGGVGSLWDQRLFRWTEAEGMVDFGSQFSGYVLNEACISADGSVIVANDPAQGAFRWTEATGRVYLGTLPGAAVNAIAYDVSADGSVIVGSIRYDIGEPGDQAFRWTEEEGLVLLFHTPRESSSRAIAVSGDGSVVVGTWDDSFAGFIWDSAHGARDLHQVLEDQYGLDIGDFWLSPPDYTPMGVSADGRVIVGSGEGAGGFQAWRAVIPEPPTSVLMVAGLLAVVLFGFRRRKGTNMFCIMCSHRRADERRVHTLWKGVAGRRRFGGKTGKTGTVTYFVPQ